MAAVLLDLGDLTALDLGLTPARGAVQAEAAAVCLDEQGHGPRVELAVTPHAAGTFDLQRASVDDRTRRAYKDARDTTKDGAEGVARLLMREMFDLVVAMASDQGTGFDYWVGGDPDDTDLFGRGRKRLEVSGIRKGDEAAVRQRVKSKCSQTAVSTATGTGAIVVVVEFGTPRAVVEEVRP